MIVGTTMTNSIKGVALTNDGYLAKPIGNSTHLPLQAQRLYGCVNCEWRGTDMCPFGFKKGRGCDLKDNTHSEGICSHRKNWLLSFSQSYSSRPTYAEWKDDFNDAMANVMMHSDYFKIQEIEKKIADLTVEMKALEDEGSIGESEDKQKEIRQLDKLRRDARADWFLVWNKLREYSQKKLDRDKPKEINLNVNNMGLNDIHRLMRNEIVVEGEVVSDDAETMGSEDMGSQDKTEPTQVSDVQPKRPEVLP